MNDKALVIGAGSAGKRHATVLKALGVQPTVVSRRGDPGWGFPAFKGISEIPTVTDFAYAVVCTETGRHLKDIQELINTKFCGTICVEKPLFGHSTARCQLPDTVRIISAYQLRFHPVIEALIPLVAGRTLYTAAFYAGQDVRTWNTERSVHEMYRNVRGEGGVLRDLSHELDLAILLFGQVTVRGAVVGSVSKIALQTEDVASIVGSATRCPVVSIQLNYLDTSPRRDIHILGEELSIYADLQNGSLFVNNAPHPVRPALDPSSSYNATRLMYESILAGDDQRACSYDDALLVEHLISDIETMSLSTSRSGEPSSIVVSSQ